MENTNIDLRLFLLNNLIDVDNLQNIYKLFLLFFCLLFTFLAFSPLLANRLHKIKIPRFILSDIFFVISIIAFVAAARWPGLLPPELNPDESQMIAGAIKLCKDPVFWRSVDGTTSGPLNYYPLVLFSLLGIKIEYAAVRIVGLILIMISLTCSYYALRQLYDSIIVRLAFMPLVASVAFMIRSDYVHYSSEHVSIAILSVSLLIFCKLYSRGLKNNKILILLLGFSLGLVPFAKPQAVPIAFAISLAFLHFLYTSKRDKFISNFLLFTLAAILFTSFITIYVFVFSIQDVFWISYIEQNIYWATIKGNYFEKMLNLFKMLINSKDLSILFIVTIISLIGFAALLINKYYSTSMKRNKLKLDIFFYYGLFFLVSAIYSVMQPGNAFRHYLLLLVMPSGFLVGVIAGEFYKYLKSRESPININRFAAAFLILITMICLIQIFDSMFRTNKYIKSRKLYIDNYIHPVSREILKYASPGQSIVVWGWKPRLYVETGTIASTRDFTCQWQIDSRHKNNSLYINRFINDLFKSSPILFIDAAGPDTFVHFFVSKYQNGRVSSLKDHPKIYDLVSNCYRVVSEIDGIKIYINNNQHR